MLKYFYIYSLDIQTKKTILMPQQSYTLENINKDIQKSHKNYNGSNIYNISKDVSKIMLLIVSLFIIYKIFDKYFIQEIFKKKNTNVNSSGNGIPIFLGQISAKQEIDENLQEIINSTNRKMQDLCTYLQSYDKNKISNDVLEDIFKYIEGISDHNIFDVLEDINKYKSIKNISQEIINISDNIKMIQDQQLWDLISTFNEHIMILNPNPEQRSSIYIQMADELKIDLKNPDISDDRTMETLQREIRGKIYNDIYRKIFREK